MNLRSKLFFTGLAMVLLSPLLRLIEAMLRARFMRDRYGSFREALRRDWWFSEGWWAYVNTPVGFWMTMALLVWAVVALLLVIGPVVIPEKRGSGEARGG